METDDARKEMMSLKTSIRILTVVVLLGAAIQAGGIAVVHFLGRGPGAAPSPSPPTAPAGPVTVTQASGGSVKTTLGYGIILNRESTLDRQWVSVHSPQLPADIVGTGGVTTVYGENSYSYKFTGKLTVKEPLSAVEVRFVTFDVWGGHGRTLSLTEVKDYAPGEQAIEGVWNIFSENEASEYYASVSYVARARTKTGKVVEADTAAVLEEAKKFSKKLTAEDLELPRQPK